MEIYEIRATDKTKNNCHKGEHLTKNSFNPASISREDFFH